MRRLCLLLALPLLAAGCTERPKAPALRDGPVYDNPNLGLRFLCPPNWTQVARSDKPPSDPGDHLLVRFQAPPGTSHASFEVTVDEQPASDDIAALVREPSHNVNWEPTGPPQTLTIGGAAATRYTLQGKNSAKDVVAVRRDKRLFLFTLIAATTDAQSREQIRQVIDGVTWTR